MNDSTIVSLTRAKKSAELMPEAYAPGDVVRLRGGKTPMTVRKCAKGIVAVDWHDTSDAPYRDEYPCGMLVLCPLGDDSEIGPVVEPA